MRRKPLTENDLINWWLQKYHNTTLEEVFKEHPDWTHRDFYPAYAVTQEQHDEWRKWALKECADYFRLGKKYAEKAFAFIYLNTSPAVKDENS
jgi:hypothetical protein